MTSFDEREKAFEAKYHLDQEAEFKITIRRNKLFGLWAAGQMGLEGQAAADYARSVVALGLEDSRHNDIATKVRADLAAKGVVVDEEDLAKQMGNAAELAQDQVVAEMKRG